MVRAASNRMTATIAMNAALVVIAASFADAAPVAPAVANKWDRLPVVAAIAVLAVPRCRASVVLVVRVDP